MKWPKISLEDRALPKFKGNRIAIPAVVLLILALASFVFIWVGYHAKPPSFDWSAAVDSGTAIGTTLLALATVWLALEARAERKHTLEIVNFQKRDEERKDRAWIVVLSANCDFPMGPENPANATAKVRVANAGHGPAINVAVALSVWGDRKPGSGKSNIGVKVVPLIMPMSSELIVVEPISSGQPVFAKNVKDLTCIDIQYRDKLSIDGMFREADPFWDITSGG